MKRWIFSWAWCIGVVLAATATADVRTCNGALTSAGLCQEPTDALLSYPVPAEAQDDFIAAWAELANYQDEVPCGAERLTDDAGIVVQAGPGDSTCDAEGAGRTTVSNPQAKERAIDRYIRHTLVAPVRAYRVRQAEAAAREAAEQEPGPRIP